jgi:hypothetical protein
MIDYDNAQIYFGAANHHKAAGWAAFGSGHRVGAIAAARRVLTRALGRPLNDAEAAYSEGDQRRDEYAAYEQALWMLENGQVADATGNDPVPILAGRQDTADGSGGNSFSLFASEALRWLGWTGAAAIRG